MSVCKSLNGYIQLAYKIDGLGTVGVKEQAVNAAKGLAGYAGKPVEVKILADGRHCASIFCGNDKTVEVHPDTLGEADIYRLADICVTDLLCGWNRGKRVSIRAYLKLRATKKAARRRRMRGGDASAENAHH